MGSSWPPLCSVIFAKKKEGGCRLLTIMYHYRIIKKKQKNKTLKNLMGVKIKICLRISVATTFTCGNEMLDKYLNWYKLSAVGEQQFHAVE